MSLNIPPYQSLEALYLTLQQERDAEREALQPILDEMQAMSDEVDDACGTSDYDRKLILLALLARHFLRERANLHPSTREKDPS